MERICKCIVRLDIAREKQGKRAWTRPLRHHLKDNSSSSPPFASDESFTYSRENMKTDLWTCLMLSFQGLIQTQIADTTR